MPISIKEGMAGSMRLKNLFKQHSLNLNIEITNIIFSKKRSSCIENYNESIKQVHLLYSKYNIFRILLFYLNGLSLVNKLFDRNKTNLMFIYKEINLLNSIFIIYARLKGYKIIIDITEDEEALYINKKNIINYFKHKINIKLFNLLKNLPDLYITISEELKNKIITKTKSKKKVILIPPLIDPDEFKSVINKTKHLNKIFTLFYGGSFGEKDGLTYLVKAIKILKDSGYNLVVNLSGKGHKDDLELLIHQIKYNGLDNNFILHGYLNREEYLSLMNNADVLCMNRVDTEYSNSGFPFKLIEMLATGNIVISSRLKSIEHYFTDQEIVFVEPENEVDLANKISSIIDSPDSFKLIAQNGNKICIEKFNLLNYDFIESILPQN